jgi:hypothetical protein
MLNRIYNYEEVDFPFFSQKVMKGKGIIEFPIYADKTN